MEDLGFFCIHSLLHRPSIYPYIHKQHHESHDVVALSANASHPVEFIGNVIVTMLGATIAAGHIHYTTGIVFAVYRVLEALEAHSGYELPWFVTNWNPFLSSSNYHNWHHLINVGNNVSEMIFLDTIFDLNSDYFKSLENELKNNEHDIKIRSAQA